MVLLMQSFFIISCEIPLFPVDNVRASAGYITACLWVTILLNLFHMHFCLRGVQFATNGNKSNIFEKMY